MDTVIADWQSLPGDPAVKDRLFEEIVLKYSGPGRHFEPQARKNIQAELASLG